MTVFELMENWKPTFTKNDDIIYTHVLKYPENFISSPIGALATFINVSHTSITRFVQKLGFANLNEFRYQLALDMKNQDSDPDVISLGQYLGDVLTETENVLNDLVMDEIAMLVRSHDLLSLVGYNLSKVPAYHLDYSLKAQGKYNSRVLDSDSLPNSPNEKEMIIIYSANSGQFFTRWISQITEKEVRPYILLVTLNPKHVLRKHCDKVVVLPSVNAGLMSNAVYAQQMNFLMFNFQLYNHLHKLDNQ